MCFFCTSAFFSLPAASLFPCSRLRGTQGARPNTKAQVWALAEIRVTCSGGSKSRKLASNHGGAFRARRAIQAHANPHLQMPDGLRMLFRILLTARTDCLPTSCSCSSARSRARVLELVLECTSCSCSRARARVLVLECSFFGVLERTSTSTLRPVLM